MVRYCAVPCYKISLKLSKVKANIYTVWPPKGIYFQYISCLIVTTTEGKAIPHNSIIRKATLAMEKFTFANHTCTVVTSQCHLPSYFCTKTMSTVTSVSCACGGCARLLCWPVGLHHLLFLLSELALESRNLLLEQPHILWLDALGAHLGGAKLLHFGFQLWGW